MSVLMLVSKGGSRPAHEHKQAEKERSIAAARLGFNGWNAVHAMPWYFSK